MLKKCGMRNQPDSVIDSEKPLSRATIDASLARVHRARALHTRGRARVASLHRHSRLYREFVATANRGMLTSASSASKF